MKKVAMIPARYGATRFPKKMLADLAGKPVIVRTYEAAQATKLFDEVWVVTDHEEIQQAIEKAGGKVFMSQKTHESGTDRIAEAAENMDFEVILNIQGDEPFVSRTDLEKVLNLFEDPTVKVASIMKKMENESDIIDPNFVKVVVDKNFNSLLFSRSPVPYRRDKNIAIDIYEHRGVYAFRKEALIAFTQMEMTPLEKVEKIECLRFLENGIPLKMVVTDFEGVEIDTEEDLKRATKLFE